MVVELAGVVVAVVVECRRSNYSSSSVGGSGVAKASAVGQPQKY